MDAASRRLLKELRALPQELGTEASSDLLALAPIDDSNLFVWKAIIRGPEGSPYQGKCHATLYNVG
jgi:ubiquitin-protein ligase